MSSERPSLPALSREFVNHFGEMGSRWGINRTVGQMYALLFCLARGAQCRRDCGNAGAFRAPT